MMIRSIISILLPIIMWGALWVVGNVMGNALLSDSFSDDGIPHGTGLLGGFITYSVVLSMLAGFTCAKIASNKRLFHVLILGGIQFITGIFVQIGAWDLMPLWYHLVFLGLVIPAHLVGGALAVGEQRRTRDRLAASPSLTL